VQQPSYYLKSKLLRNLFCVGFCFLISGSQGFAQTKKIPTRLLFILDASGSMAGKWQEGNRMDAAKAIITHMADSLAKENISFALRIFGHQSEKVAVDCNDTKLELPFAKSTAANLSTTLANINPKGYSPIALSLEQAVNDFTLTKYECKNVIVLITDGFENCEGDACMAAEKLQAAGIFFRPYIIGLGLNSESKIKFDCVGQVFEANESAKNFKEQISEVVISTIMNPTSLQVNLLSEAEKPIETNVNMTFYDQENKVIKYNIIHTLNTAGNPDTLFVDPQRKYDVKIHTIPAKAINNIELIPGKHTIAATSAGQGSLKINMAGTSKYKNLQAIVKQKNQIINIQNINSTQNYLTGVYSIEILTCPKILISELNIIQSQQNNINIPAAGSLQIVKAQPGYLSIFKREQNNLIQVTVIPVGTNKQSIQLQPGNYELTYRAKNAISNKSTVQKKFTIVSGIATTTNF
jgi:Ca-activated chloride channel family protein